MLESNVDELRVSRRPTWSGRALNVALHVVPAVLFMAGAWVAGCSCEEDTGDFAVGADPNLQATPASLSFSSATTERPETLTVVLSNTGTGAITDFSYSLVKNEGPFTFVVPEQKSLGEGESMAMEVSYQPNDDQEDSDVLVVEGSFNQRVEIQLNSLPPRRELQCDPGSLVIAAGELGEPVAANLDVVNIGTLPATISAFNIEVATGEFEVTSQPDLELELRPQERTTLEVTFTPQIGGAVDNTLRVLTNEQPGLFTCLLRGTTPLPQIQITPNRVDFGSVPSGETVQAEILVENIGDAPLTVQAPAFLRDSAEEIAFLDPPTGETVLGPDEGFTLTATYTAAASTANATAILVNSDPSNPQAPIPMLGRVQRPDLVVSPPSINFGNVGQGAVSTRTLNLFNNGTQELIVSGMSFDGTDEFYVEPDGNFPPTTNGGDAIIAPQTGYDVRVSYSPANLGQDFNRLTITSNDPEEPALEVPVTANGLDQAECEIRIRPDPLNFGLVTRGSETILAANVINIGSGNCRFVGAMAAGFLNTAFRIDGTSVLPGDEFGPGETLFINVLYNPTSADINNGTLSVDIEDPLDMSTPAVSCNKGSVCVDADHPDYDPGGFNCISFTEIPFCGIELTGFAGPSSLAVIPGAVDFGLVTLGCASQATTVTIYNTGSATLNIFDIRLAANCSGEFELRGVPLLPQEVAPDSPIPVQVVYRPDDLGPDQCALEIESDASEGESILRVPLRGEGTNISRQTDVFEQVSGREVDVLFVIDGSGSMSEEQGNVADNLGQFLQTAELLDNEFQIGVTHLDLGATQDFGGQNYEAGELIGDPPFLTPNTPDYQSEFRRRVRMGATGGSQEAGLEAARIALSDPLITSEGSACNRDADCDEPYNFCRQGTCGGRNADFLREDASLEVVIVSDEEDQSTATPAFYTDFFRSIKGFRNDALLHVSVIVGAEIGSNTPAGCSSNNGDAEAGRRYASVADSTGGTVGSICAASFGTFLQNIGNRAFGLRVEFFLSRAAEPATIEVRINGQDRLTGWTFDEATNSVIFNRNSVPQPGDTIEVEYEARCFP